MEQKLPTNRLSDWDDEYPETLKCMKSMGWTETEICNNLIFSKALGLTDEESLEIAKQTELTFNQLNKTKGVSP